MKFLINIICAFFSDREKRRAVRTRLVLFFYARRLKRVWKKYPELNDKIVISTNGGLGDQLTVMMAIIELQKNKCPVVFNLSGLKNDLPVSSRLYEYSEIENTFGKSLRTIKNDLAQTPFELYKYKINWDGVLFANLPDEIKRECGLIGISLPKIDAKTRKLAPLCLEGVGALPHKNALYRKHRGFLKDLEISYELDPVNKQKLAQIVAAKNSICIHIRRGDYVKFMGGRTVSAQYFQSALAKIIAKTGWKSATCFVFSDDWEWARTAIDYSNNDAKINVDFVAINKITHPQNELELMRNCNHFIVSVGHFGNLGFEMSPAPDKMIIKPGDGDFVVS